MTFADITITPVPHAKKEDYFEFSRRMAAVYRDHGATRIVDYWQADGAANQSDFHADGTSYSPGELRGIAQLVGVDTAEAVVVSVTEWPSRAARDKGNAAATQDPRVIATLDEDPVFDGKRLLGDSFDTRPYPPGE